MDFEGNGMGTKTPDADHDCPDEVRALLLMHDETNAQEHREHARMLREMKWEYIQLLAELKTEKTTRSETFRHISKGVLTWVIIAILSTGFGILIFAAKDWIRVAVGAGAAK